MDNKNNHFNSPEGISIKEYVNDKFDNLEKSIDMRFDSVTSSTTSALETADKATDKAEVAIERRLDGLNEFRAQQKDIIETFARKTEVEIQFKTLNEKIDDLNESLISIKSENTGREQGMGTIALIAGVTSTIIGVLFQFFQ
jgi:hypothetical protein